MDRTAAAERVLSIVTTPEYAHTIVGDLVECNEHLLWHIPLLFLRLGSARLVAFVSDLSTPTLTGLALLQLAQALAGTAANETREYGSLEPDSSAWIMIYLLFCRLAFPFVVGRILASSGRAREVAFVAICTAVIFVAVAGSSTVMGIAPALALFGGGRFGGGACARSAKEL